MKNQDKTFISKIDADNCIRLLKNITEELTSYFSEKGDYCEVRKEDISSFSIRVAGLSKIIKHDLKPRKVAQL